MSEVWTYTIMILNAIVAIGDILFCVLSWRHSDYGWALAFSLLFCFNTLIVVSIGRWLA